MDVIAAELQDRDFGIVVLTRDNLSSPWVNFETGALGKSLGVGKVAPLLLDITRADVEGPIAQFQSTLLTSKVDMRQFVRDLAIHAPDLPEATIDTMFEVKWTELEKVVTNASNTAARPKTTRTADSMLEEVLHHVRVLRTANRIQTPEDEESLRLARLDHLQKMHGSKTYMTDGELLEVRDYDPSAERVLIPIDDSASVFVWRHLSDGQMVTPF